MIFNKKHVHLVVVGILALSIFLSTELFGLAFAHTSSQGPDPLLYSVAERVADRTTLSTRTGEFNDIPLVVPTPVPPAPSAIPLPPPPPPPVAAAAVAIRGTGLFRWPLSQGARVSTFFNSGHQAIDLDVQCGTPVIASLPGVISYAGWKNNGGGIVVDLVSDGFLLSYVHLSAATVGSGASVVAGQQIGYSGATGWAYGCHLHFGVTLNGVPVNPLVYL